MAVLRQLYPWPEVKPDLSPFAAAWENWSVPDVMIGASITEETRLVVELGSWLGGSARFILDRAPNAVLVCVDHWKGSSEHYEYHTYSDILPTLYEDFLSLCWDYRDRLIPVKETTLDGLRIIADLGLVPDVVYVDASHDYESVKADIEMVDRLFPTTTIIGDDYCGVAIYKKEEIVGIDYGVRRAVNHFIYDRGWGVQCAGRGWQILRRIPKGKENTNGC